MEYSNSYQVTFRDDELINFYSFDKWKYSRRHCLFVRFYGNMQDSQIVVEFQEYEDDIDTWDYAKSVQFYSFESLPSSIWKVDDPDEYSPNNIVKPFDIEKTHQEKAKKLYKEFKNCNGYDKKAKLGDK